MNTANNNQLSSTAEMDGPVSKSGFSFFAYTMAVAVGSIIWTAQICLIFSGSNDDSNIFDKIISIDVEFLLRYIKRVFYILIFSFPIAFVFAFFPAYALAEYLDFSKKHHHWAVIGSGIATAAFWSFLLLASASLSNPGNSLMDLALGLSVVFALAAIPGAAAGLTYRAVFLWRAK